MHAESEQSATRMLLAQSGWWTGGRLLVDLSPSALRRYMRFSKDVGTGEWGREDLRTVLESHAAVVFMSEAAAGSARDFPWWHGRVGDGITMTIDIRIGQPTFHAGSRKGSNSAPMFFFNYANGLLGTDEAHAGGGSAPMPVADYPTSKLLLDEASSVVCSWCEIGKPDFESNDIFKSKSFFDVWRESKAMHVGCINVRRKYAQKTADYVAGQRCPYLVPVAEDEDDAEVEDDAAEEACDWDEGDAQ
jgi:hypothetical protein